MNINKMNWLIGSVALGVGIIIGSVGYALASTAVSGQPQSIGFWGKDSQPVTGTVPENTTNPNYQPNLTGGSLYPQNPLNPNQNPTNPYQDQNQNYPPLPSTNNLEAQNDVSEEDNIPKELVEEIISSYKQNIGTFFEAWKSPEMVTFRSTLAKAYKGDLYERHARQAESYLAQGIGLEVTEIEFKEVLVESANLNSATLIAEYSYVAKDYDIASQTSIGESREHSVKVRVNLIKDNSRWLITGETIL